VIYGALIWGDYPDRWTILGALVILASGLYILHRELLRRKA
jgi:drug/metabolite transporter (DMT)-like permease